MARVLFYPSLDGLQISLYIHPVWQGFSFIPLWMVYRSACTSIQYGKGSLLFLFGWSTDQPVHPSSMARVLFYPHLDGLEALEGTLDQRRLIRLWWCAGWWAFATCTSFYRFCRAGSYSFLAISIQMKSDSVDTEDVLTLVLLNPEIHCKQCRSRSVGLWRSQLIWIYTVCHSVREFISTTWIK